MRARVFAFALLLVLPLLHTLVLNAQDPHNGTIPGANIYLPLVNNQPAPTATSTPTATNTAVVIPTKTPAATNTPVPPTATPGAQIICDHDAYNCSDFSTQAAAQAVYNYCLAQVGFDVHHLDNDHDGTACESLPLNIYEFKVIR